MNSTFISMVEKAKRYSAEPERVSMRSLEVSLRGNNDTHTVSLRGDDWSCECDHFGVHGLCTHVMTLQRIFAPHLSPQQRFTEERVPA